jgi:3'-phosphoadenosine 5'-phosphosulfate sulfotransferase (PAPS reductase)/FAD synthetase
MIRVHFSCGAASAVSLLLAVKSGVPVDAVYADTGGEHPDNLRFLRDIEKASGIQINIVRSKSFLSPLDVWTKRRFIKGPHGAPCTSELKRLPLRDFWTMDREHVFGFTINEKHRLERIQENESPMRIRSLLIEDNFSKDDCFQLLYGLGIDLPAMYKLGFNNANCIGCPKGGKGYWNRIRKVFPDQFNQVAVLQRELGVGAAFWEGDKGDERLMLDELPLNAGNHDEPNIECGMFCTDQARDAGLLPPLTP